MSNVTNINNELSIEIINNAGIYWTSKRGNRKTEKIESIN